jgi:hypothetical protein
MADERPGLETGTPRWVKVFGSIFAIVVLLFLIMMFTRGPHRGPRDHMPFGGTSSHTPSASGH